MWWRRKSDPKPQQPYLERLEPRILYSADFGAALLGASAPGEEEQRLVDSSGDYVSLYESDTISSASLADAEVSQALANSPLTFEANVGQTDDEVDFVARGSGYRVFLAE